MSLKAILLTSLLATNPNVENDMADSLRVRGVSEQKIERFIRNNEFKIDSRVERLFERNPERDASRGKITYDDYRQRLGLDYLIENISEYVNENKEDLHEAQRIYGVDHRYIAAIKGIESRFGQNTGSFNLVNTLYSQFQLDHRRRFASDQLAALIRFSEKNDIPIEELTEMKSSYAGAIGQGQFIPSSLEAKYVKVDEELFSNKNFIHSIANYLANNRARHPRTRNPLKWNKELNGKEMNMQEGNYYAIWGYNRSLFYVKAIDELANTLEYVEIK